ncbi:MAG: DUF3667 domain-containing protein [Ignavibacteriales bacterium]|nr:DUF3667 domain-containing protein [Ignavibacteriales bacterium]
MLVGKYCHNCGERILSSSDYSLRKFIEESVDVLTHYDSKLYRSIRLLMSRPGFLTHEYFEGRRISHVKPVQLFLLINMAYFLAVSLFGSETFATPLEVYLNHSYYGSLARAMVETRVAERNMSIEQYQVIFDYASATLSKSLIFTMIPFLALILQALYWRPRHYYVENLVFSIHFFSYLLVFLVPALVSLRLALLALRGLSHWDLTGYADYFATIIVAAATLSYLFLALRRVRAQSAILTLAKATLITFALFYVLWIYRFVLFVTCFYFS